MTLSHAHSVLMNPPNLPKSGAGTTEELATCSKFFVVDAKAVGRL